jgi:FlaG/FlaF family flagellin (archaellin)
MAQILYAIIVVLSYPRTAAGLILFAQTVVQKMTGNAYFPTPTPALSAVTNAIGAYQAAVGSSATTKGLKGHRIATRNALLAVLRQVRDYVRTIAEANPALALEIVESAGMTLKKHVGAVKEMISVIEGAVSGSVECRAKAPGIPANYFWSYSLDQKTWTSVPEAMKSTITITGLTPGQVYYFRYYTMTRKGTGNLSQTVNLMVK